MIYKSNIISNLIWKFLERSGAQLVAFVVSIILARLLSPDDYGTIALVTVFIAVLNVFVDSGLGSALIQKKNADDLDFSTVFYTNIIICIFLYIVMYMVAPLIALFYERPELKTLVRVLSLTIVVSGVKNVQHAYVSRNMLFKKFFLATLGGTVVAAVVGILMAYGGYGVWALVAQQLINVTVDTTILWVVVKWRPIKAFSLERLRKMFNYGWKLLVSALLDTGFNELRQLVIGKVYTTTDLAYYNKADQFPKVVIYNINSSIDSVLLPTLSEKQDDRLIVREMTRRAIKTSIYVMAPLMLGMVAVADKLVLALLTEKWGGCVPYMRVFCVVYMFYPIHTANLNAIKAMGHSDIFLKLEVVKKVIGLTILLVTMRISVWAMCIGTIVSCIFSQIINSFPNKRLLNYSYLEQIKDIIPAIILAVLMAIVVYILGKINFSITVSLLIQVVVGITFYIVGSAIMKLDSFCFIRDAFKNFINS